VHRQNQDDRVWQLLLDPPGDLDAVQLRHHQVDHQHIWPQPFHQLDGLKTGGGLADHLEIGFRLQQKTKTLPDHVMIVC
jgi:hypothetical protein